MINGYIFLLPVQVLFPLLKTMSQKERITVPNAPPLSKTWRVEENKMSLSSFYRCSAVKDFETLKSDVKTRWQIDQVMHIFFLILFHGLKIIRLIVYSWNAINISCEVDILEYSYQHIGPSDNLWSVKYGVILLWMPFKDEILIKPFFSKRHSQIIWKLRATQLFFFFNFGEVLNWFFLSLT